MLAATNSKRHLSALAHVCIPSWAMLELIRSDPNSIYDRRAEADSHVIHDHNDEKLRWPLTYVILCLNTRRYIPCSVCLSCCQWIDLLESNLQLTVDISILYGRSQGCKQSLHEKEVKGAPPWSFTSDTPECKSPVSFCWTIPTIATVGS